MRRGSGQVMNRLFEQYKEKIVPDLKLALKLDNDLAVPTLEKIVVNAGIGGFREHKDNVEYFTDELAKICGQSPYPRPARKSEAGFKIRRGNIVGLSATLRGERMWAFMDKFINIVLPRLRDFKGVSDKSFDKGGNYSVGISEHTVFPEVNPNTTKGIRSLEITIVPSLKTFNKKDDLVEKSRALLASLGMPFRKEEING
jgi:large subunit ribosomal protein L5